MRKKLYDIIKKIYGIIMTVAFFSGFIPLIPFIIAIIIGGSSGEAIALFLYKEVYPYIIAMASLAIVIGTVAMYIGKKESLSVKEMESK